VTVPPASLVVFTRVAEKVMDVPTAIDPDEGRLRLEAARSTTRGSHVLTARPLFESPKYWASQLKEPTEGNVWGDELGTTPLLTVTVETGFAEPVQSAVENRK
jgi:hypothetical protein